MFIFVVPLRSSQASADWARVSNYCVQSIKSMLASNDPNVRVILVGHEIPKELPVDDRLIIHDFDGKVPESRQEMMQDKCQKVKAGLILAREFSPAWLMKTDADDLVSNDLTDFMERQDPKYAWYVNVGYVHKTGSALALKMRNFHMVCGSSFVSWVTPEELPEHMEQDSSKYWLLAQGHHTVVEYFRNNKMPVKPIPFPSVIYRIHTGENWSGDFWEARKSKKWFLKKLLNSRPVTPRFKQEFGLLR